MYFTTDTIDYYVYIHTCTCIYRSMPHVYSCTIYISVH